MTTTHHSANQAARYLREGRFEVQQVNTPMPGAGEVQVRTAYCWRRPKTGPIGPGGFK